MNRTVWIIIGVLCLVGFGTLVYVTKKDTVNVDATDITTVIASTDTTIGDHVTGNADAKVTLFEYADFQCPGCAGAHKNTPTIQATYKDVVRFVFRNFPLVSIHPNALAASSAAEAAGLQGKYWEMNDLLYNQRDIWVNASTDQRTATFESFATQLSLNTDQFKADLSSSKIQDKIQLDLAIGKKAGVDSTPTFFIGSTKVSNETTNDVIQQKGEKLMDQLDEALKQAGVTPPSRS